MFAVYLCVQCVLCDLSVCRVLCFKCSVCLGDLRVWCVLRDFNVFATSCVLCYVCAVI